MTDKTGWRAYLLEDAVIVVALLCIGVGVAVAKLAPALVRWAKKT
jgi:hypothetical protein